MAASFKHYIFALSALAGVYSAQLTVGIFSSDDGERTIAQVESQVTLSQENVLAQITKKQESISANIALVELQLKEASELKTLKSLKELRQKHEKLKRESAESQELFKNNVQTFLATQDDTFDPAQVEEGMAVIAGLEDQLSDAFNLSMIDEKIAEHRDNTIDSLQSLVCEQRLSISSLKDDLSSKIAELSKLIESRREQPSSLFSPNFAMPWTQMFQPFSQHFNPFSFFMGGFGPLMNMGGQDLGSAMALTQNNFYGKVSFDQYSFKLPEFKQAARDPSQVQNAPQVQQHVPPAELIVPSADRGQTGSESFSF